MADIQKHEKRDRHNLCIKPLLLASFTEFDESLLVDFVHGIVDARADIHEHPDKYEGFYSALVVLGSYYLSSCEVQVPGPQAAVVREACDTFIKYILSRLRFPKSQCAVSQHQLVSALQGLCLGVESLSKSDIAMLASIVNSAQIPNSFKPQTNPDNQSPAPVSKKRSRRKTLFFSELTSALGEHSSEAEQSCRLKTKVMQSSVNLLNRLNGEEVILAVLDRLAHLERYRKAFQTEQSSGAVELVSSISFAASTRNSYPALLNDISSVWGAFKLPLLVPMIKKHLEAVVEITMATLRAALTVAHCETVINVARALQLKTATKDTDIDSCALSIVQKALDIVAFLKDALQSGLRPGSYVVRNFVALICWYIVEFLKHTIALTPSAILERSKVPSTLKVQEQLLKIKAQSHLSMQVIMLGSKGVEWLKLLLDDVGPEELSAEEGQRVLRPISVLNDYSPVERMALVASSRDLLQWLFGLFHQVEQCSLILRESKKLDKEDDTSSLAGSYVFSDDPMSLCSNCSSEDLQALSNDEEETESEENVFGRFFERVLAGPEPEKLHRPLTPPSFVEKLEPADQTEAGSQLDTQKSRNLAIMILKFLEALLKTENEVVRTRCVEAFGELNLSSLVSFIRDLDRESERIFLCENSNLDYGFSGAAVTFLNALVPFLSMEQQERFLSELNLSPKQTLWPLNVGCWSLSVLAQVLSLRLSDDQETEAEKIIYTIWLHFLDHLKYCIEHHSANDALEMDVNVEHIQVLLLFFLRLPIMQRKALLLYLGQMLIDLSHASELKFENSSPIYFSRLLLIFEYLIHHMYEVPELMKQVQWNLFSVHFQPQSSQSQSSSSQQQQQRNVSSIREKLFIHCHEIQDDYDKHEKQQYEDRVLPRFYYLFHFMSNEPPKIDTLAASFLLSVENALSYDLLHEAFLRLMAVGARFRMNGGPAAVLGIYAVRYYNHILWRIMRCLPPSLMFVESIETAVCTEEWLNVARLWGLRMRQKSVTTWIRDSLMKQGASPQRADVVLQAAQNAINSTAFVVRHGVTLLVNALAVLPADVDGASEPPPFHLLRNLDVIVTHLSVVQDAQTMDSPENADMVENLLLVEIRLVEVLFGYLRWWILKAWCEREDSAELVEPGKLTIYDQVLSVCNARIPVSSAFARALLSHMPQKLCSTIERYNAADAVHKSLFPAYGAWKGQQNEAQAIESHINSIMDGHLRSQCADTLVPALQRVLSVVVRCTNDQAIWWRSHSAYSDLEWLFFELMSDARTEFMADHLLVACEKIFRSLDDEKFVSKVYFHIFTKFYDFCVSSTQPQQSQHPRHHQQQLQNQNQPLIDEKLLIEWFKFVETEFSEKLVARTLRL